jgi:hypothetical protein
MQTLKEDTFLLGTSLKITTIVERNSPDTVTITIRDPSDIAVVTNAVMTEHSDNIFSYVFQSSTTYDDGYYEATITATYGVYKSVKQKEFEMIEQ